MSEPKFLKISMNYDSFCVFKLLNGFHNLGISYTILSSFVRALALVIYWNNTCV